MLHDTVVSGGCLYQGNKRDSLDVVGLDAAGGPEPATGVFFIVDITFGLRPGARKVMAGFSISGFWMPLLAQLMKCARNLLSVSARCS